MYNQKGSFKHILSLVSEFYPVIIIYSICISVLTLSIPISVQSLVNTFSLGPYFQPLFILTLVLFGVLIILGVLQCLQYLMTEYLQRRLYAKLAASVARWSLIRKNRDRSISEEIGFANRYFDIVLIQKKLSFLVTDGITFIFQTIVGMLLIFMYHPAFIFYGFLILFSFVGTIFYFYNKCLESAVAESSEKYRAAAFFESLVLEEQTEEKLIENFKKSDAHIQDYLFRRKEHFSMLFTQNIIFVGLYAIFNALLLGFGGYLVLKGLLTVGQLVAAEIIVNSILYNFLNAKKYIESFYDLYAAVNKVGFFLREENLDSLSVGDPLKCLAKDEEKFFSSLDSVKSVFTPENPKKTLRNFLLAAAFLLFLLALVPWQQTSLGKGKITVIDPNDRTQVLTAAVSGRIEKWLVQDGQVVKSGEPIVQIVDNDPDFLGRLELERDAAIKKFEAAKASSDTARLNFNRQRQLMKEGLSSRKEFEKSKITYKKLISDEASAVASLAKAEVNLSRQKMQIVTAPRDGQVFGILYGSGSVVVKAGEPIASFVPSTQNRVAEVFIDGNDLPLIFPGRKVRLQFEGWPAFQLSGVPEVAIGSFGGVVKVVDPFVSENGQFRVIVEPDPEEEVTWPDHKLLRQGSRVFSIILLDQVALGYELWRKVNGFPKSMDSANKKKNDIRQKLKKVKK